MKLLFDLFPIILFFITYKFYGFYVATAVTILASLLQFVVYWIRYKKIDKILLITTLTILLLGSSTLIFKNEMFLKWKPTVVYWVLSTAFLISQFSKKTLVEYLLPQIQAPTRIWKNLNISWICFFILMGGLNLYVAYHFSTDSWVNFKLIGVLGITLVFVVIQAVFLSYYVEHTHQDITKEKK